MVPREHKKLVRGGSDRLVITVEPLDPVFWERGGYGADGNGLPIRYRFAHPAAHESLVAIETDYPGVFFYSDFFRNASGSRGRRKKNRAKRIDKGQSPIHTGLLPGSSGHGFGLCKDHYVEPNLRRLRLHMDDPEASKEDYDLIWRKYGWYCHRDGPTGGDHKRGSEWWHYNYFGDDVDRWLAHSYRKTSGGLEAKIDAMYGPFVLDAGAVDAHLQRLGYRPGRRGRTAIEQFQEDWTLTPDDVAGPRTQRVLLYVGAQFRDGEGNAVDVPFP